MKSVKQIFIAAFLMISTLGAVIMASCTKSDDPVICPTGYTGFFCEKKTIIGNWKGEDKCDTTVYKDITITLDSTAEVNSVIVTNPGGFGPSVKVNGVLSADARTITIKDASVGGGNTISGDISLTSDTSFTINYEVAFAGTTVKQVCTGGYIKF